MYSVIRERGRRKKPYYSIINDFTGETHDTFDCLTRAQTEAFNLLRDQFYTNYKEKINAETILENQRTDLQALILDCESAISSDTEIGEWEAESALLPNDPQEQPGTDQLQSLATAYSRVQGGHGDEAGEQSPTEAGAESEGGSLEYAGGAGHDTGDSARDRARAAYVEEARSSIRAQMEESAKEITDDLCDHITEEFLEDAGVTREELREQFYAKDQQRIEEDLEDITQEIRKDIESGKTKIETPAERKARLKQQLRDRAEELRQRKGRKQLDGEAKVPDAPTILVDPEVLTIDV